MFDIFKDLDLIKIGGEELSKEVKDQYLEGGGN